MAPRPSPRSRPLADVATCAEYIGTTERHVRLLVHQRRIPYIKVGRLVRFDLDSVDGWLAEHTSPAAS